MLCYNRTTKKALEVVQRVNARDRSHIFFFLSHPVREIRENNEYKISLYARNVPLYSSLFLYG